jgi:hypothetical protein
MNPECIKITIKHVDSAVQKFWDWLFLKMEVTWTRHNFFNSKIQNNLHWQIYRLLRGLDTLHFVCTWYLSVLYNLDTLHFVYTWYLSVLHNLFTENTEYFSDWSLQWWPPVLSGKYELNFHLCFIKISFFSSSAAYCEQCTSHLATSFTSQRCTLFPAHLYQKDVRALFANLHCSTHFSLLPLTVNVKCLLLHLHPCFISSLSVSLGFFYH